MGGARDVRVALEQARRSIAESGSESAALDALVLLRKATGWGQAAVLAHPEWTLSRQHVESFDRLVAARVNHEPVAYLLGEREFYGRSFLVDRRVLIPRPETEMVVEAALRAIVRWRARGVEPRVLEVGTGTGAIAVSVAAEARVRVEASEVSANALAVARQNIARHGQDERVTLQQADLLAGVVGPVHLLLANLPYVPSGRALPADVRDHEPHLALFAGPRGTELNERLLRDAARLLAPGGEIALEMDADGHAAELRTVAEDVFPGARVTVERDGAGLDRLLLVIAAGLSEAAPGPPLD